MLFFDVLKAVCVRLVLLVHSLLVVWLAASITHQHLNWLLALLNVGLLVETIVTLVVNKGQEWKWFCPCFFFYLCSTIPGIWILELNRMKNYQDKNSDNTNNITHVAFNTTTISQDQSLDDITGIVQVHIPIQLPTDTWVVIMEQLFLYLMILARWILPRGEITRNELSQLLFVFIGIASDITELFALFEEEPVRMSEKLTYAILCIWTVSLLQFTLVLTATHSPKKTRSTLSSEAEFQDEKKDVETNLVAAFFQTEVWSICVNFLLQDGPFLAIRLYTMIEFNLVTYSIIFFTAKNGLLVIMLVYRLSVLCMERKRKVKHRDDDGDGSEIGSNSSLKECANREEPNTNVHGSNHGSKSSLTARSRNSNGIKNETV